jgi:hypothetical protein
MSGHITEADLFRATIDVMVAMIRAGFGAHDDLPDKAAKLARRAVSKAIPGLVPKGEAK